MHVFEDGKAEPGIPEPGPEVSISIRLLDKIETTVDSNSVGN
jgi:hypothetical protein